MNDKLLKLVVKNVLHLFVFSIIEGNLDVELQCDHSDGSRIFQRAEIYVFAKYINCRRKDGAPRGKIIDN